MNKLIILLFALAFVSEIGYADDSARSKDSLLRVLSTQPSDSTRLETLRLLAILTQSSPTFLYYEDQLYKEAVRQENLIFQSVSWADRVIYYYNNKDRQSMLHCMNQLSKLMPKVKLYGLYFSSKYWTIESQYNANEIELGIYEARKMEVEALRYSSPYGERMANLSLLGGYIRSGRMQEAMEVAGKVEKAMDTEESLQIRMNSYTILVTAYVTAKEPDRLYRCLKKLEGVFNLIFKEGPSTRNAYDNTLGLIEIYYAEYYLLKQQPEQATRHFQKVEKLYSSSLSPVTQGELLQRYVSYYFALEQYDKALACADSAISFAEHNGLGVISLKSQKAKVLNLLGNVKESIPIYQKIIVEKDSIDKANSQHQMEQIRRLYNIDKLQLKKEELKSVVQIVILSLMGIAFVLLVFYVVRTYIVRRKLRESESDTRQATSVIEEASEMKSRFLTNMSYNIRIPLNNVVGFSQLMATSTDMTEEERQEYSEIIQQNSSELLQLVNDVLDLSRLESGMMRFNLSTYDMVLLCSDAVGQVKMKFGDLIQIDFQSSVENAEIETDVSRLLQILNCMLSEPEKACKPLRIEMKIDRQDALLRVMIVNAPLANKNNFTQRVSVHHEINRLFIEHFGGSYQVLPDAPAGATIIFTYPVCR